MREFILFNHVYGRRLKIGRDENVPSNVIICGSEYFQLTKLELT